MAVLRCRRQNVNVFQFLVLLGLWEGWNAIFSSVGVLLSKRVADPAYSQWWWWFLAGESCERSTVYEIKGMLRLHTWRLEGHMKNLKQGRLVGVDEAAGACFLEVLISLSVRPVILPCSESLWFHSRNQSQPVCPPQFLIELCYFHL